MAVILDLCLRKTRADKSPDYRDVIVFRKASFSKRFPSTLKRKAPFSNSSVSVDGRPNRRNKAPFSNPSGVVWTGSKNYSCFSSGLNGEFLVNLTYFLWTRRHCFETVSFSVLLMSANRWLISFTFPRPKFFLPVTFSHYTLWEWFTFICFYHHENATCWRPWWPKTGFDGKC